MKDSTLLPSQTAAITLTRIRCYKSKDDTEPDIRDHVGTLTEDLARRQIPKETFNFSLQPFTRENALPRKEKFGDISPRHPMTKPS